MSKVVFGRNTSVNVSIIGIVVHPTRERTLTLGFASQTQDYQCLVNLTQFNLDSIAHALNNRPDPCPDYLVFEITPDLCSDEEEPSKIGLQKPDQDLFLGVFKHAPSLLDKNWLTYEDTLKLVNFQNDWIKSTQIQRQINELLRKLWTPPR